MSFKRMSCTIAVSLFFVWPIVAWAATTSVDVSSGHISIVSDEAPLSSVADQLSKKAGISIYLDRSAETRKVSVDVRTTSLEKAVKSLAHPLNYAIVTDQSGKVTELRIFKNGGLKDSEYRLFAAPRPTEVKVAIPSDTSKEQARMISSAPGTQTKHGSPQVAAPTQTAASNMQQTAPLAGPSSLVTGERAFQSAIWATKRMMEAEQIRQTMQVRADQAEVHVREVASVTSMVQTSSPNFLQQNTPQPQPGSGVPAAQQTQQGQQSSAQAYQQYSSQQRGFGNNAYYQQRAMRENSSLYTTYRGR